MNLNLSDKIALVSGSGRGIGKAIAELLIKEGCTLFINDRDESVLTKALVELEEKTLSKNLYKLYADLTVTENIKAGLKEIYKSTGRNVDIVVANIGLGKSVSGWDVDDEEWYKMFNINLFGAVRLCRESIRIMKDGGGGSIVCISSIAGVESLPAPVQYSAAKASLLSFVKNTANIVAQFGIRINAVSPGNVLFEGGTWDMKLSENRDNVMDYINTFVPLKDFASPYDIANMVAFLASDMAKFITGSNFIVDGGQVRKFI